MPKPATPEKVSGDNNTVDVPTQQVIVGRKCYQIPTNVYESFNGDHSKIKAYIEISSGAHPSLQSAQGILSVLFILLFLVSPSACPATVVTKFTNLCFLHLLLICCSFL